VSLPAVLGIGSDIASITLSLVTVAAIGALVADLDDHGGAKVVAVRWIGIRHWGKMPAFTAALTSTVDELRTRCVGDVICSGVSGIRVLQPSYQVNGALRTGLSLLLAS